MQKQNNIAQLLKDLAGQKFTWFALGVATLTITAFTTQQEESPFTSADTSYSDKEPIESSSVALIHTSNTDISAAEYDMPLPAAERIAPSFEEEPKQVTISTFLKSENNKKKPAGNETADELVAYAQSLMGTPYNYGGTTTDGFDCSGFVYHVFNKFNQDIERSSRTQSVQGEPVQVEEAQPGDLLFFTGTNPKIREVGHVGIVISEPGEPVTFVHSSSNGGVKISELEGYYTTRFMSLKRML